MDFNINCEWNQIRKLFLGYLPLCKAPISRFPGSSGTPTVAATYKQLPGVSHQRTGSVTSNGRRLKYAQSTRQPPRGQKPGSGNASWQRGCRLELWNAQQPADVQWHLVYPGEEPDQVSALQDTARWAQIAPKALSGSCDVLSEKGCVCVSVLRKSHCRSTTDLEQHGSELCGFTYMGIFFQ